MGRFTKPANRILFLACTLVTGSAAGAFVWAFFCLMDAGLGFVWETLPRIAGRFADAFVPGLAEGPFGFIPFPLAVCLLGGLIIGLYEKKIGFAPEELTEVMATVKKNGRYPYDHLGKRSVAALLPLLFGASVGPEAGLTGVIAGLCSWVGDRMRRFGSEFRELTLMGTQAALTALFTAPLYGFVAPLSGSADGRGEHDREISLPRTQKTIVYCVAIVGALGSFILLGSIFGGAAGLPRFDASTIGTRELAFFIPLVLLGTLCGWAFHASNTATRHLGKRMENYPVLRALIAGLALGLTAMVFPYVLFAGEHQSTLLQNSYWTIPALSLLATAFLKAVLTPLCINFGWRGGHFFPLIFCGISLGFGLALITGADPAFCVAASTAALMGSVMRQPLMASLLLIMCFPLKGAVVMLVAALIGSALPLPKAIASTKTTKSTKSPSHKTNQE